jgi:hypothetical protein
MLSIFVLTLFVSKIFLRWEFFYNNKMVQLTKRVLKITPNVFYDIYSGVDPTKKFQSKFTHSF